MAADMLGVDVMYLANEGNLCLIVGTDQVPAILNALHSHPECSQAAVVGQVVDGDPGTVRMIQANGRVTTVPLLFGAQLPRLC